MHSKIIIGVLAVVLVGAGGYFYLQSTQTASVEGTGADRSVDTRSAAEEKEVPAGLMGEGSFLSLMQRGESIHCTFSSQDEVTPTEGEFYFSDDNYRVEATTHFGGTPYASQMIGHEDMVYIWGDSPQGAMAIKLAVEETEADDPVQVGQDSAFDMEQGVAYDCDPWQFDPAVFVPPADIAFMDMQTMFEGMFSGGMPEGFEIPEGMELPADLQIQ